MWSSGTGVGVCVGTAAGAVLDYKLSRKARVDHNFDLRLDPPSLALSLKSPKPGLPRPRLPESGSTGLASGSEGGQMKPWFIVSASSSYYSRSPASPRCLRRAHDPEGFSGGLGVNGVGAVIPGSSSLKT